MEEPAATVAAQDQVSTGATPSAHDTGQEAANDLARFFAAQDAELKKEYEVGRMATIAVVLAVTTLVLILGSPLGVIGYAGVLLVFAWRGAGQIGLAVRATENAVSHLQGIATFLESSPNRETFLQFLRDRRSTGDKSNVPEAFNSRGSGPLTGERIQGVARGAFSVALAELNVTGFLRSALVLGGLFGTVLFFALELTGGAILLGNIEELLPGLRGALASTLTGILTSVLLGWLASRLDRRLDQLVWETEALISGPVSDALGTTSIRREVTSEADFWAEFLRELSELTRRTTSIQQQIGNDASVYARALESVSTQLANLPAIQVPDQFNDLGKVVGEFREGMQSLHETVDVLLPAVQTLGLQAPAEMMNRMDTLAARQAEAQQATEERLRLLREEVLATRGAVEDSRDSLEAVDERIRGEIASLAGSVGKQGKQIEQINSAIGGAEKTRRELEEVKGQLESVTQTIRSGAGTLQVRLDELRGTTTQLQAASESLSELSPELRGRIQEIALIAEQQTEKIAVVEGSLQKGFQRLEPIAQWHAKATSAPLMRMLLSRMWPLDRNKQLPSQQ